MWQIRFSPRTRLPRHCAPLGNRRRESRFIIISLNLSLLSVIYSAMLFKRTRKKKVVTYLLAAARQHQWEPVERLPKVSAGRKEETENNNKMREEWVRARMRGGWMLRCGLISYIRAIALWRGEGNGDDQRSSKAQRYWRLIDFDRRRTVWWPQKTLRPPPFSSILRLRKFQLNSECCATRRVIFLYTIHLFSVIEFSNYFPWRLLSIYTHFQVRTEKKRRKTSNKNFLSHGWLSTTICWKCRSNAHFRSVPRRFPISVVKYRQRPASRLAAAKERKKKTMRIDPDGGGWGKSRNRSGWMFSYANSRGPPSLLSPRTSNVYVYIYTLIACVLSFLFDFLDISVGRKKRSIEMSPDSVLTYRQVYSDRPHPACLRFLSQLPSYGCKSTHLMLRIHYTRLALIETFSSVDFNSGLYITKTTR